MHAELISKEEYLSHHGVKGQSWGDRNGPPYPLSRLSSGMGEKIRKKRKAKLQKENEKIRKRNAALRKRNKEIEENKRLAERQKELKAESKNLKKGKNVSSKPKKETEVKEITEVKVETKKPKNDIKSKNLTRKDIRKMSNEEIKVYIDRLQLEKQLWQLDNDTVMSGKKVVGDILKKAGKESAESIAKSVFTGAGKYAVKKMIAAATDEDIAKEIMGGGDQQKKKKQQQNN